MENLLAAVLKYINVNEKQKLYFVGLYYFKEEQWEQTRCMFSNVSCCLACVMVAMKAWATHWAHWRNSQLLGKTGLQWQGEKWRGEEEEKGENERR